MSDQTRGAEGERVAEVEEIIKFSDLHILSDDELLTLMYGISCNSLSLDPPCDSNIALKWPLELLLSSQYKPTNNTALPPEATKQSDLWCYPQAPPYMLNPLPDDRFSSPVSPQFVNGKAMLKSIPGMVKMEMGIPYVYEICGDPGKIVTGRTDSKGLGFSSCTAPLTRVCALNFGMTSGESPRKSEGLPEKRGKLWKDFPDECEKLPDECRKVPEELPEITMEFRPDGDMCNGYSGQVLSRRKQRKGCKDKVRSRIGPEDRGKVPEELPETWRIGGMVDRRSGGAEEQSSGLGNSSLGLRWIITKSEE
ncbi:uncharacterized protein HD556DRAFT_1527703 [Suillus plorans]|uniref:Uncharacterized protein n=1 Tax=Suillus plorans TaxID=116603 RepID=A0A9P7DHH1_9AGAM|nr:uncharacterized protein HD556DRAFT_1527703 [Suillus plorans]KAG1792904.1 hypothetical protein HD556DRAFT_1527703 [Suillus plorans]